VFTTIDNQKYNRSPPHILPFSSSSVCFECLCFLYTSCFVGSHVCEGMELGLAEISFALKTGSVTEVFPLTCVASLQRLPLLLFYYRIVLLCNRILIDFWHFNHFPNRNPSIRQRFHSGNQDVVSVCLGETTDLQEQLQLSKGDRDSGTQGSDNTTALSLAKDDFL